MPKRQQPAASSRHPTSTVDPARVSKSTNPSFQTRPKENDAMRIIKQLAGALAAAMCIAGSANAQVVISQVYGGGGNTGAQYTNDFVELLNTGSTPVDITGWSVQYASQTDSSGGFGSGNPSTNVPVVLSGTLQPGQYYLVQLAAGANNPAPLPTPDATGTINMNATQGRVALVNNATVLGVLGSTCNAASIVDLIGYSSGALCFEGAPAATLSNSTAHFRANGGCVDTNNNAADFSAAAPAPRNSASPFANCAGNPPTGSGSAFPFVVCNTEDVTITVTVTPGSMPASTGITVTGNLTPIGGSNAQSFTNLGGNTFEWTQTVGAGISAGLKSMTLTISDAQNRTTTAPVDVLVDRCYPSASGLIEPLALCAEGGMARVVVFINPASTGNPVFAAGSLTADLSLLGGSASQVLYDDGTNGDRVAFDNTWSFEFAIGAFPVGVRTMTWSGMDLDGRMVSGNGQVEIINCSPSDSQVVISQVYGGGGNAGADYKNDFIEIFNRGQTPVDLTGWSVQYASSAGAFNAKTDLTEFSLQPGQYYLIQQAVGSGGTLDLPTPDAIGNIAMSATGGKVALVNTTTLIGANCSDPSVMDLVAYGTGQSCQEGLFGAPGLTNTVANFRLDDGCQDTDQNAPDFFPGAPAPRNTASPFNICAAGPATGACCLLNQTCSVMTAAQCDTAGGFYLGDGAACNQTTCNGQSVACCINGSCTVLALGGCIFSNGTPDSFAATCSGVSCPANCPADWDGNTLVEVNDIFSFLTDWFAGIPAATNFGGSPGVPAIFAFLSAWFAHGVGPC
ncbi:MAG: lamin tail domain-containing protein [Phycisphaeraceae bacterium]|nr:lamin tail domain-containing protein [Phycisphaeraceae bacterium]